MSFDSMVRPESLLNFASNRRYPHILQSEASECGLACLAVISSYHGYQTDLTSIRQHYQISTRGANLQQLMTIATEMKFTTRAVRLELNDISNLKTPCILHWEMNHFVVLKEVNRGKVVVFDPAWGDREYNKEELGKYFTGVALELIPTSEFKPGKEKHDLKLSSFWSNMSGLKRSVLLLFGLAFLLQLYAIASPYYMQTIVDDVILRGDTSLLLVLALGFTLLLFIEVGTSLLRSYVSLTLSNSLNIQMSANVFHHLIRLTPAYFQKRHMGDILSRFGSLHAIRELMTHGIIAVALDGLMALVTLIVLLIYSPMLTAIVVGVVCVYGFIRFVFYKPLKRLTEESIVTGAKENSHFMESLRAVVTIKLFGKEGERESQWQNKLATSINSHIKIARWNIHFSAVNAVLFGLESIVIIYLSAELVMENVFSLGMLYAFLSYKSRFVSAMDTLIGKWIEFKMMDLQLDRLADIVLSEKESTPPIAVESPSINCELQGKLTLKNVSYAYSKMDKPIFSKINLEIYPGETVALIGPSGSGKTTLLKCMMGLFQCTDGEILVDDMKINTIPKFREHISGVLQDDQLLSGSMKENIACFATKIDMNRVVECAKLACIHEDIMNLAMQYNTLVGDMGSSLSGGQKQRVMLARAFYKEPKILFLDEATSHLDLNNEKIISQNIRDIKVTRVIVAHRPETIMSCDRILQVLAGEICDVTAQFKGQQPHA